MKVFISADMEGISGVATISDIEPGKPEYGPARGRMAGDVNAAVAGALAGGAREVVVFDAHAGGENLDPGALHEGARLIRGQPAPAMIGGVDETFDAVFLVGYHARVGTAGAVMDHTMTGKYYRIVVNGREMGELGLAAACAGSFGVPVVLVTGDDKLAAEAAELLPDTASVVVKEGISRTEALCLHPAKAQELIRAAAEAALGRLDQVPPLKVLAPVTLEVEFPLSASADWIALLPTVERTGPRSVRCVLPTMPDASRLISAMNRLVV